MKGERSLEFNKIHKCLKRKTFKGWLNESYLCHFTPDLSPPKATTRKANERSCFLRCSIKSLICSTPKRGFYSLEKIDGLSAVEGVAGWWLRRGPFISLRDRRQTAMAAATLLAPVAMNIEDTKINWLYQKNLSLSQPHHLNGKFIPLWAAFTAEMEWWLLKLL